MSDEDQVVTLPWPVTSKGRDRHPIMLRVGDRVWAKHIARTSWMVEATVVRVRGRGRPVDVRPDEPITSPAKWLLA